MATFHGQDRLVTFDKSEVYQNTMSVQVHVAGIRQDHLLKHIRHTVEQHLICSTAQDPLRARQDPKNFNAYTFTTLVPSRLSRKLVVPTTKNIEDLLTRTKRTSQSIDEERAVDVHFELTKMLQNKRRAALWVVSGQQYFCVVSHAFVDGVRMAELASMPLDMAMFNNTTIPPFLYIPLVSECMCVQKMDTSSLWNRFLHRHRTLTVDYPFRTFSRPDMSTTHCSIDALKTLKRVLEKRHGRKISMRFVVTAFVVRLVFLCTSSHSVNIGIVGAIRPICSATSHFNNFTAGIAHIVRPATWDTLAAFQQLCCVVAQLVRDEDTMNSLALGLYIATNVHDLDVYGNNFLDCLVSCAPPTQSANSTLLGHSVSIQNPMMVRTTLPLYVGCMSTNNVMHFHLFSRCKALQQSADQLLPPFLTKTHPKRLR